MTFPVASSVLSAAAVAERVLPVDDALFDGHLRFLRLEAAVTSVEVRELPGLRSEGS